MFGNLLFCVTFCSVLDSICQGHLHPPINLTYKWLDPLTVNVSWSWKRPKDLPRDCEIKHKFKLNEFERMLEETHYQTEVLTESTANWMCSVQAVGTSSACNNPRFSVAKLPIKPAKPPAVLTDFRCYLSNSDMNCSWISDPSSPVSISYRECGTTKKLLRKGFSNCSQTYNSGPRTVCQLNGSFLQKQPCMVATTPHGVSTFRPKKGVNLPNMDISEQGTNLVLTWAPLEVQTPCLLYNVCYSVCNTSMICRRHLPRDNFFKIRFDESCQYKFKYRVQPKTHSCPPIYSVWSEEIIYGSTDRTLTVVAIVIPLFVSACVILSCICFRRHRKIICPEVPDPSAIFKDLINSDKEIKLNVSIYTAAPEPCEPILIVPHIPRGSGLAPT